MTIYDVTLGIHDGMLTWPGDPSVSLEPAKRIARGDPSNVSLLTLGTHTGTHVDAPFHFIDGAPGIDSLPPDVLYGDAVIVDMRGVEDTIGPDEVNTFPEGATRVLMRTRNSELWKTPSPPFPDFYVAMSPEGARAVVDRGITLLGTDFLSIEKKGSPGHPTHVTLLEAGVVIVEGLDLSGVEPGRYTIACMPLKLVGSDGSPARVFLIG
ncbi:MAG: cyclase family protein [Actinomycetota bacterium]